jgi:hypothetical protein
MQHLGEPTASICAVGIRNDNAILRRSPEEGSATATKQREIECPDKRIGVDRRRRRRRVFRSCSSNRGHRTGCEPLERAGKSAPFTHTATIALLPSVTPRLQDVTDPNSFGELRRRCRHRPTRCQRARTHVLHCGIRRQVRRHQPAMTIAPTQVEISASAYHASGLMSGCPWYCSIA